MYYVVFLYETIGRIVIYIVEMEADIGRKPFSIWDLIQTDIETVQLSSLRILTSEIKQPDSEYSPSAILHEIIDFV